MNTHQLEHECLTYTRYLMGRIPSRYVVECYLDCHRKLAVMDVKVDAFDRFLLAVSAHSPFWVAMVDSYATVLRKESPVRKKLILTLALQECAAPTFKLLDAPDARGALATVAFLARRSARFAFLVVISVLIFTPVRFAMALSWKQSSEAMPEH